MVSHNAPDGWWLETECPMTEYAHLRCTDEQMLLVTVELQQMEQVIAAIRQWALRHALGMCCCVLLVVGGHRRQSGSPLMPLCLQHFTWSLPLKCNPLQPSTSLHHPLQPSMILHYPA